MLQLKCQVILRAFNGTSSAPAGRHADENYWILIGQRGTVVETINERGRVLVQFDGSISERGLHCHNPFANSLYILESDLEKIA